MDDYYYWYEYIPSTIDYKNYENPADLLNAMRYSVDRWSYVADKQEFDAYFHEGSYTGIGVGFKFDFDSRLRVTFVYDSSPLKADGVKRGWIITKINDVSVNQTINLNSLFNDQIGEFNKLEFIDLENNVFENTYSVSEIIMNSVIHKSIVEEGSKRLDIWFSNRLLNLLLRNWILLLMNLKLQV